MWGNPTRERERDYYSASGKYKTTTKPHFQPRKIPHSTKFVTHKSASFSVPKPYCCMTSSIPHFPCPQLVVRTVSYGPETTTKILKSTSKIVPEMPLFLCQIRTTVRNCTDFTDCTDPYSTTSHNRKIFQPKTHRIFFLRIRALFPWKTCPLCCSLSSLKLTQKIYLTQLLSMSSQHLTCLAHYPMHSFII
jgi:hypothetical protein